MAWTLTGDVAEYLTAAGDFLRSRAVENTVQLVATETIRVRGAAAFGDGAPLFGWWAAPGDPARPAAAGPRGAGPGTGRRARRLRPAPRLAGGVPPRGR